MKRPRGERRLARMLAGPRADESGFSIMEFILAMTLLLIIIVATAQAFTGATRVSANVRQRIVATNLATQYLEQLRGASNNATSFATIPITNTVTNSPRLDGTIFSISQTVEWEGVGSAGTACDSGTSIGLLLRATVVVSWPGSATTVQSSTLLAPPLGSYSTSQGAVGIKVLNANGSGNQGVKVTPLIGGNPLTPLPFITTGADGCAFFNSLPVGPYTFSLAQDVPFIGVDSQEAHLSITPFITSKIGTTVQNPAISYDDGATIAWTYTPVALGTIVASNMWVSVANPGLAQTFFPYSTSAYPLFPAYPYPSGYTLFAGDCSDSNPLGKDSSKVPFYPAATAPTVVVVSPHLTSAATVALYPLNINVIGSVSSGGGPVNNPTLTAVLNATVTAGGGACPFNTPRPVNNLTDGNGGGVSNTGVGLGHLMITAKGKVGGVNKTQIVYIWVKPDGVYLADKNTGAVGALVYTFAAPSTLQIQMP